MNKLDHCILCNSTDNGNFYPGIVKCNNCGHVFADLELSDEQFKNFIVMTIFMEENTLIINKIKMYSKKILFSDLIY